MGSIRPKRQTPSANISDSLRYSLIGLIASSLVLRTTKRATRRTLPGYAIHVRIEKKIGNTKRTIVYPRLGRRV
jgi:hypothetical protein